MSESTGNAPAAKSDNGKIAVWESEDGKYFNVSVEKSKDEKFRFSMGTKYFDVLQFEARDVIDMMEGNDVRFDAMPTKNGEETYPVAFYIDGFKDKVNGEYTNYYARVEKAPLILKDDRVIGYRLPVDGTEGSVSFMSNHKIGNEYYPLTAHDCVTLAKEKEIERGGFKFRFDGVEDKGKFRSAEVAVINQKQGKGISV